MEISIKRVTFASSFGFLMTLCLAAATSGCVGAPDEVDCGDGPADPEPDPVDPPQPYGCTVGEVEDWGEGMTPSIAGSDEGYAVVYAESWEQSGMVRMVALDGEPTSPLQNLPIDPNDQWAQVTHGRNGYLVSGSDIGSYGGEYASTIYMMDQSGAILRSYGPLSLWNWGVSGGLERDWILTTFDFTASQACPSGRYFSANAIGPAGTANGGAPSQCLFEESYAYSDLTLGFAGRKSGYGFALGLRHWSDTGTENDPYAQRMRLQVGVYDDGAYREVTLAQASGHVGLSISRIVATDDGYAVRWSRFAYDYSGGGSSESEGYLTFLGSDGHVIRTVRTERPIGDIAWNGREIGEITYDDFGQVMLFSRYGTDGLLLEETEVAITSQHYMSLPKIASGAGGFAVIWADHDYVVNDRPHLQFAPIACE